MLLLHIIVPNSIALGQTAGAYVVVPKNCGDTGADPPLGIGPWLTLRNTLLYHLRYYAEFGHSRSNHRSIINGDPLEKYDPSCTVFQGHSRSLETSRMDD